MITKKRGKKTRKTRKLYGRGVERTTITVPRKIKKRMESFQDKFHVNWSAIATDAFRQYMKENNGQDEE
jgi:hypothetical protein